MSDHVCVCVSVSLKSLSPADHVIVFLYNEIVVKMITDVVFANSPTADYTTVVIFHCSVFSALENIYHKITGLTNVQSLTEMYFCFNCCFTSSLHSLILCAPNKDSDTCPVFFVNYIFM